MLLVLGAMAVALCASEGILRLTMTEPGGFLRHLHEAHPDRPWLYGLRPDADVTGDVDGPVHYAINADGFRGPRRARPKPSGVFRVVAVGDSVTFGYGVAVDDAFPSVLERVLAARAEGARIEVVNLGVNGYNPYTEGRLLEDVGLGYEPDLVLVQFCPNDLNDPTLHFDASTQLSLAALPAAAFPDPSARRPPPSLGERLCRSLRLCRVFQVSWQSWFPDPAVMAMLRQALVPSDGSGPELEWLRARYTEMARAAEARGGRLVVGVFPYQAQLEDAPAELQARLVQLGNEAGWPVIDLLPPLRRARAAGATRLFLDQWHPGVGGHRVAADAIARALACRGLVPVRPEPDCG